ncbi:MAG: hypothetical protein KA004_00240 [Verrucomicrobiales bacterium]|nr:hypothetical protein [Verrucomicrobiales bacterium]
MKHIPTIAGALLGLVFVTFGLDHFLGFLPKPPGPAEGSPAALFFGAIFPTGFFSMVKVCEITGGLLVALPKTRNLGLLILGPIIVNILGFHTFIGDRSNLLSPPVLAISVLGASLLWCGRRKFAALLN